MGKDGGESLKVSPKNVFTHERQILYCRNSPSNPDLLSYTRNEIQRNLAVAHNTHQWARQYLAVNDWCNQMPFIIRGVSWFADFLTCCGSAPPPPSKNQSVPLPINKITATYQNSSCSLTQFLRATPNKHFLTHHNCRNKWTKQVYASSAHRRKYVIRHATSFLVAPSMWGDQRATVAHIAWYGADVTVVPVTAQFLCSGYDRKTWMDG